MYAQILFYKDKRLLAYQHVKTSPVENFQYFMDISADTTTLSAIKNIGKKTAVERLIHSLNIGNVSNGNASVSVDIFPNEAGHLLSFVYSAGNGFILQKFGDIASNTAELDYSAFKMYPNPASDVLNILSENIIKRVVILDVNGRIVRSMSVENTQLAMDVSIFQEGLYLLSVETAKGIYTQKLLIQK
jgi:hypothetical protein